MCFAILVALATNVRNALRANTGMHAFACVEREEGMGFGRSGGSRVVCKMVCNHTCPQGELPLLLQPLPHPFISPNLPPLNPLLFPSSETDASACTSCAAGKANGEEGATSESSCATCSAGKYSSSDGSVCTSCAAGKYGPSAGASSPDDCVACEEGKANGEEGASSGDECEECPPGKYRYA
jgi:hypothetical protein